MAGGTEQLLMVRLPLRPRGRASLTLSGVRVGDMHWTPAQLARLACTPPTEWGTEEDQTDDTVKTSLSGPATLTFAAGPGLPGNAALYGRGRGRLPEGTSWLGRSARAGSIRPWVLPVGVVDPRTPVTVELPACALTLTMLTLLLY